MSFSPTARPRRLLGGCLAAAAASAALVASAQPAQAAFTLGPCGGSGGAAVNLQGSSFQNAAETYWRGTTFVSDSGCKGTPAGPAYRSTSSGNGNAAMGAGGGDARLICAGLTPACTNNPAPAGQRDPGGAAAATDEPPTPTQQAAMNGGPTTSTADDGLVHVIPVATGATTVLIHAPEGCDLSTVTSLTGVTGDGTGDTAAAKTRRIRISNTLLEAAYAGASNADTWGELAPGISGTPSSTQETTSVPPITDCGLVPVKRIVRADNSGTTYSFKNFLQLINPARGWLTTYNTTTVGTATTNAFWPNSSQTAGVSPTLVATTCPNSDANKLCGSSASGAGGGQLGDVVNGTDGSIGYLDIATARTKTFDITPASSATTPPNQQDYTFWTPLQANPTAATPGGYVEPTSDPASHTAGVTTRGAACGSIAVQNVPTAASSPKGDPTLGDWSKTFAAGGSTSYPNCVLTYLLAWDDSAPVYGNSDAEQAKARTVKDFLQKGVLTPSGQLFTGFDYSPLPDTDAAPLLTEAKAAAMAIDWNKTTSAPPTTTTTTMTTPPPTTTAPATTTTPPPTTTAPPTTTTPVVTPPSNAFTLSSLKATSSNKSVSFTVNVPSSGKLTVAGSYKAAKKTVKLATVSTSVSSGAKKVTVKLSSKTRAAIRKAKKLSVSFKIGFTPTGGDLRSITKKVTLKK